MEWPILNAVQFPANFECHEFWYFPEITHRIHNHISFYRFRTIRLSGVKQTVAKSNNLLRTVNNRIVGWFKILGPGYFPNTHFSPSQSPPFSCAAVVEHKQQFLVCAISWKIGAALSHELYSRFYLNRLFCLFALAFPFTFFVRLLLSREDEDLKSCCLIFPKVKISYIIFGFVLLLWLFRSFSHF